eukprot:TRINITY_DN2839_c0_g1_i1.p1 TRINITY_DN2839_c0_g1~~TRINITY_DN2839_c0_g1_i1.p1  ORF type:complete len:107 (+),score=16.55 TRINITY_DN2839_c0_g1_i1:43-363(+)
MLHWCPDAAAPGPASAFAAAPAAAAAAAVVAVAVAVVFVLLAWSWLWCSLLDAPGCYVSVITIQFRERIPCYRMSQVRVIGESREYVRKLALSSCQEQRTVNAQCF